MKKFISIAISFVMLLSVFVSAGAVMAGAVEYNVGDMFVYEYTIKCDNVLCGFEGRVEFPKDKLTIEGSTPEEINSMITVFDGKTGSNSWNADLEKGVIKFTASNASEIYDFTEEKPIVTVLFSVTSQEFNPADIRVVFNNIYDDAHYSGGNNPFDYKCLIDGEVISYGHKDLDNPENDRVNGSEETTAPTETATNAPETTVSANTTSPSEPATTEPAETTTPANTTVPDESSTGPMETTIPSDTATTTTPSETSTEPSETTAPTTAEVTTGPMTPPIPSTPQQTEPSKPEPKPYKAATYFEKGYTGDVVCAHCGEMVLQGKAIAQKKLDTPKVTVKGAKKKITVKYTKVKSAKGFVVEYQQKGKKAKTRIFATAKSVTKTINSLKKGTYTVKVRAYITSGSKKAYSSWTKAKAVKVK